MSRMCRYRFFQKLISCIVANIFIFQQLSWGEGEMQGALHADAVSKNTSKLSDLPENFQLLGENALIEGAALDKAGNDVIINIEDSHSSLSGQYSIVNILKDLVQNYDLKVIAIEGGSGYIDTSILRTFPDKNVRDETAAYLMKGSKISAGEFFAATSDDAIALYGAEDNLLYQKNLEMFRKVHEGNRSNVALLGSVAAELKAAGEKIFSPDLRQFIYKSSLHRAGKISLSVYWEFLEGFCQRTGLRVPECVNIEIFMDMVRVERTINFTKAALERKQLIDALIGVISEKEMEEMVKKAILFEKDRSAQTEYYDWLMGFAKKKGINTEKFAELTKFADYLKKFWDIDIIKLQEEITFAETQVIEKIFSSREEEQLFELIRIAELLHYLFRLRLSAKEVTYLSDACEKFEYDKLKSFIEVPGKTREGISAGQFNGMLSAAKDALEFYRIAELRNKDMVLNTLSAMKKEGKQVAALISGGHHTSGLTEIMKEKGLSYLIMMPKDMGGESRPYVAVLTKRTEPYKELAAGGDFDLALEALFTKGLDDFKEMIAYSVGHMASNLKGEDRKQVIEKKLEEWVHDVKKARRGISRQQVEAMTGEKWSIEDLVKLVSGIQVLPSELSSADISIDDMVCTVIIGDEKYRVKRSSVEKIGENGETERTRERIAGEIRGLVEEVCVYSRSYGASVQGNLSKYWDMIELFAKTDFIARIKEAMANRLPADRRSVKVVLLNLVSERHLTMSSPISVETLAADLRGVYGKGVNVKVVDMQHSVLEKDIHIELEALEKDIEDYVKNNFDGIPDEKKIKKMSLEELKEWEPILQEMRDHINDKFYTRFAKIQSDMEKWAIEKIKEERPDILGLSIKTAEGKVAERLLEQVYAQDRSVRPKYVIVGGHRPRVLDEEFLEKYGKQGLVACYSEGELAMRGMVDLVRGDKKSIEDIPNISYLRRMKERDAEGRIMIDTAHAYGLSEELLGVYLKSLSGEERQKFIIATKWGENFDLEKGTSDTVHSVMNLKKSVEESKKHLGKIDLLYIHGANADVLKGVVTKGEETSAKDEMIGMRERGDIRWLGASISRGDVFEEAVNNGLLDWIDVVQINPFIVDKMPHLVEKLKQRAEMLKAEGKRERGIAIVVNSPYRAKSDLGERVSYEHLLNNKDVSLVLTGTFRKDHFDDNLGYAIRAVDGNVEREFVDGIRVFPLGIGTIKFGRPWPHPKKYATREWMKEGPIQEQFKEWRFSGVREFLDKAVGMIDKENFIGGWEKRPGSPMPVKTVDLAEEHHSPLNYSFDEVEDPEAVLYWYRLGEGCKWRKCRFCNLEYCRGTGVRRVPTPKLLADLKNLKKEGDLISSKDANFVSFTDTDFMQFGPDDMIELAEAMIAAEINIEFWIQTRADNIYIAPEDVLRRVVKDMAVVKKRAKEDVSAWSLISGDNNLYPTKQQFPFNVDAVVRPIEDITLRDRIKNEINGRFTEALSRVRQENIKKREALRQLRKAGLRRVFLGIESGSNSQLARYNKGVGVETIAGAIKVIGEDISESDIFKAISRQAEGASRDAREDAEAIWEHLKNKKFINDKGIIQDNVVKLGSLNISGPEKRRELLGGLGAEYFMYYDTVLNVLKQFNRVNNLTGQTEIRKIQIEGGLIAIEPFATLEELKETMTFLKKNDLQESIVKVMNIMCIEQGSGYYKKVQEEGLLKAGVDGGYDWNPSTLLYSWQAKDKSVQSIKEIVEAWMSESFNFTYALRRIVDSAEKGSAEYFLRGLRRNDFELLEKLVDKYLMLSKKLNDMDRRPDKQKEADKKRLIEDTNSEIREAITEARHARDFCVKGVLRAVGKQDGIVDPNGYLKRGNFKDQLASPERVLGVVSEEIGRQERDVLKEDKERREAIMKRKTRVKIIVGIPNDLCENLGVNMTRAGRKSLEKQFRNHRVIKVVQIDVGGIKQRNPGIEGEELHKEMLDALMEQGEGERCVMALIDLRKGDIQGEADVAAELIKIIKDFADKITLINPCISLDEEKIEKLVEEEKAGGEVGGFERMARVKDLIFNLHPEESSLGLEGLSLYDKRVNQFYSEANVKRQDFRYDIRVSELYRIVRGQEYSDQAKDLLKREGETKAETERGYVVTAVDSMLDLKLVAESIRERRDTARKALSDDERDKWKDPFRDFIVVRDEHITPENVSAILERSGLAEFIDKDQVILLEKSAKITPEEIKAEINKWIFAQEWSSGNLVWKDIAMGQMSDIIAVDREKPSEIMSEKHGTGEGSLLFIQMDRAKDGSGGAVSQLYKAMVEIMAVGGGMPSAIEGELRLSRKGYKLYILIPIPMPYNIDVEKANYERYVLKSL